MGQVETDRAAPLPGGRGDRTQVERLPGVVVDPAEEHQRDLFAPLQQERLQIVGAQWILPGTRRGDQHGGIGIESVPRRVGRNGVLIRRECLVLHQDLGPPPLGPVERHHHQVKVDREAVHHDDLTGLRADEAGAPLAELLVVGVPRPPTPQVPVHGQRPPVVQLFLEQRRD